MGLPTKDEIRDARKEERAVPIDWDAEVSLSANRDLFNRLAQQGYTADQIGKLSVAQAKAIVGDDIATLAEIETGEPVIDPANSRPSDRTEGRKTAEEVAVEAIQSVRDQAEEASKDADKAAKGKASSDSKS